MECVCQRQRSAPSHSFFKQHTFKVIQSSGERHVGLGQKANRFRVFSVLLPAPHPPLTDCYMGCPLPSILVHRCPTRRQDGGPRKAGEVWVRWMRGLSSQNPGPASWIPLAFLSVCPCVQGWPQPSLLHVGRDGPPYIIGYFWGCHHGHTQLPASRPLCVPLTTSSDHSCSHMQSSLMSVHASIQLHALRPASLPCVHSVPGSSKVLGHVACGDDGPSCHLGRVCKVFASFPAAAWGPLPLLVCGLSRLSPYPSRWWVAPCTPLWT